MPEVFVDARFRRLLDPVHASLAQSTWVSYHRVWNEWVSALGGEFLLSSPQDRRLALFSYLIYLQDKDVSGSTVGTALSALSFWFRILGWEDITKDFLIRRVLKGWKRLTSSPDSRRPVSVPLLTNILSILPSICFSAYEVLLFQLAFSWAFFGAFRISELVSKNRRSICGILAQDVLIADSFVSIQLRSSKTDTLSKGKRVVLKGYGGPFCPVLLASSFSSCRPSTPVFLVHADSSNLSRFQFLRVFRICLSRLGLPPTEFSTHSFRIGAATAAHGMGFSDEELQRLGRWDSFRFSLYVRPHLLF